MILSYELESNGSDSEPRGTAVKGHWSKAWGEGQQRGREKNNTLIFTDLEPCVPL